MFSVHALIVGQWIDTYKKLTFKIVYSIKIVFTRKLLVFIKLYVYISIENNVHTFNAYDWTEYIDKSGPYETSDLSMQYSCSEEIVNTLNLSSA